MNIKNDKKKKMKIKIKKINMKIKIIKIIKKIKHGRPSYTV